MIDTHTHTHIHTLGPRPEISPISTDIHTPPAAYAHTKKDIHTSERERERPLIWDDVQYTAGRPLREDMERMVEALAEEMPGEEPGERATGLDAIRMKHGTDPGVFYSSARRQERAKLGVEGLDRVVHILAPFGHVSTGIPLQSSGTQGYPDLTLRTRKAFYGIEVKTMAPFIHKHNGEEWGHANNTKISRNSWELLTSWTSTHGLSRLMVVETRIQGSPKGPLYFIIPGAVIDALIRDSTAEEWVNITFYDLPVLAEYILRPGTPSTRRPEL